MTLFTIYSHTVVKVTYILITFKERCKKEFYLFLTKAKQPLLVCFQIKDDSNAILIPSSGQCLNVDDSIS